MMWCPEAERGDCPPVIDMLRSVCSPSSSASLLLLRVISSFNLIILSLAFFRSMRSIRSFYDLNSSCCDNSHSKCLFFVFISSSHYLRASANIDLCSLFWNSSSFLLNPLINLFLIEFSCSFSSSKNSSTSLASSTAYYFSLTCVNSSPVVAASVNSWNGIISSARRSDSLSP